MILAWRGGGLVGMSSASRGVSLRSGGMGIREVVVSKLHYYAGDDGGDGVDWEGGS